MTQNQIPIIGGFLFVVALGFVLPKISQPLSDYDYQDVSAAEDLLAGGKGATYIGEGPGFWHPPLYVRALALAMKIAGPERWAGRWVAVVCFILTGLLVFKFARDWSLPEEKYAGILALGLFAFHPLSLQGLYLMDHADTSLLPLSLTLFWLVHWRTRFRPFFQRMALLSPVFCLCLWSKMTTSLVALGTLGLAFLIHRNKEKFSALAAALAGFGLFAGTWYLYCEWFNLPYFWTPFRVAWEWVPGLARRAGPGGSFRGWGTLGLEMLRVGFWFSPFLLICLGWIYFERFRKGTSEGAPDELFIFAAAMLGGYTLIGATINGYPKYQGPVLPVLCVLAAVFLLRRARSPGMEENGEFLTLGFLAAFCAGLGIGDVLHALNYGLREAAVFGGLQRASALALGKAALWVLPAAVLFFLCKGRFSRSGALAWALLMSLAGTGLALDFIQVRAPYNTLYAYGTAGKREVLAALKSRPLRGNLLALPEITYDAGAPPVSRSLWLKRDSILRALRDPKTSVFVCGLQTHTVRQLKWIFFDPEIQRVLAKGYKAARFGSFWIFRRSSAKPS